jgi:Zn-dependent protease/predicted transcriptional regulator
MRHSWRIGKILGIDIKIDSSWLIIFALLIWILAGYYFPQQYPSWPRRIRWTISFFTSILFFASVLIHELAHSFIALKQGEKVKSITLFILGGVAEISEEPKKPMKEFYMALVGPLTSLVLGALFLIIWAFIRNYSEPIGAMTLYLGIINIALAFFNLLPGFPMDGGRVLRAIIWKVTGNLKKATRIASLVGQVIAFLLIFLGIWQLLSGIFIGGIWLIFIGWFLHSASVRGYQQVMLQEMLKDLRAEDLMNRDFIIVKSSLSIKELVENYVLKHKDRAFMVSDNFQLEGIICLEDIKKVAQSEWPTARVADIMTPKDKLETVSPLDDGNTVLSRLTAKNVNQLPVVEKDEVTGIVCRTDILQFLQLRMELGV